MSKMIKTEIDISNPIDIISKNILKILLFTIFCMFIGYFFHINQKKENNEYTPEYFVQTTISPITIFDEQSYEVYNKYLVKEAKYFTSPFKKINSEYLLELFLSKISLDNDEIILNSIKDSGILKNENFDSEEHYYNAVQNLIDTIRISYNNNLDVAKKNSIVAQKNLVKLSLKTQTNNRELISNFISEIEKKTNIEVRKFIINNFNLFLKIEKDVALNQLPIDINTGIFLAEYNNFLSNLNAANIDINENKLFNVYENYSNNISKILLEKKKENLKFLVDFFNSSKIRDPKKFQAAKINKITDMRIKKVPQKIKTYQILAISAFGGIVFSTIFVLMFNLYLKRRV